MNPTLDDLAKLEENWDSYGSSKISKAAIETAQKLLDVFKFAFSFPEPYTIPSPDGGISLEWHSGNKEISLDVSKDGELGSFYIFDGVTNYNIPSTIVETYNG